MSREAHGNALPADVLQVRAPALNFYVLRDASGLYLLDSGFIGWASFCIAHFAGAVGNMSPFAASSSPTGASAISSTSARLLARPAPGLPPRVSTLSTTPVIPAIAAGRESPQVAWRLSADPFWHFTRSFPTAGSTTATLSTSGTVCVPSISLVTPTDTWASTANDSDSCSAPTSSPAIAELLTFHRISSIPFPNNCERAQPSHWHLTSPASSQTTATAPPPKNICSGSANCNEGPNRYGNCVNGHRVPFQTSNRRRGRVRHCLADPPFPFAARGASPAAR
jgi:hypothetical protein